MSSEISCSTVSICAVTPPRSGAVQLDWVKKIKVVIKGGVATFENGKIIVMRNWKYRNRSAGVDDLIDGGTSAKPETLARIKDAYPGLKIKYDKWAQPDFSGVAKYSVEVKGMTGQQTHDAALAMKELECTLTKKQYKELVENISDYRLHHSSTGQILVVPKDIHTVFTHTGPTSFMRAVRASSLSMSYTLFALGLSEIRSEIIEDPNSAFDITEAEILVTAGIDVVRWFDPFFESSFEAALYIQNHNQDVLVRGQKERDDAVRAMDRKNSEWIIEQLKKQGDWPCDR